MKRSFELLLLLTILTALFSLTIFGQRATSFKFIDDEKIPDNSKLYITVNGKKRLISENSSFAWLFNKGKEVAFVTKGMGWDGQALWLYDVAKKKSRKIISEYDLLISDVKEANLSNGKRALLIELAADGDAGDGSLLFAVIDPQRGRVLFREYSKLTSINGDFIKLSFYKEKYWLANQERRLKKKAKPYKIERLDLKKVLKNKVIVD